MKLGKVVMVAGAALQSAATVWVLAIVHGQGDGLSTWDLAPALVVSGIGLGLLVVPLVDVALATIPTTEAGAASGAYGTVQQVGAALGVAVTGTVFFGVVGTSYDAALAAVRPDRRVLGGRRRLRPLRGGQPAAALPEPGARAPGGRGARAGRASRSPFDHADPSDRCHRTRADVVR